jgi:magnesium transporter
LSVLEEWRHYEKEDRTQERRVKEITEPQLINGRLRPVRKGWFQTAEEVPYRFTYFNEEFQSTIHSQTISELVQPGSDFRELFIPDPRILSDDESSDDNDDETVSLATKRQPSFNGQDGDSKISTRQPSVADSRREGAMSPNLGPINVPRRLSPSGVKSPNGSVQPVTTESGEKPVRYGERPVWWLDVLCPTEAEMKVIAKAFGIHPLTAEDIMLQEAREKVELFRHYYFVNYRTFDQDINSGNYLEPVNMYVVVFREGVLSFHFSMTPHPANVRRRIRQLRDYLILSSDWISYAIIDDITDVFQPLIQTIEDEVDEIDENILRMHNPEKDEKTAHLRDDSSSFFDSGDMLRRVGDCRKRVMSLYRLLGNKADVIKGFAKRCNERWEVAPRSEIGLYLGDIQDHIVTMTSNLGHYEKYAPFLSKSAGYKSLNADNSHRILARSHGNYLAQINIRMNERQEQTADVLGKLTVLGTIVLPMNIITGLWGMNVWVPGQEHEGDLAWFFWITAGLILFGTACFLIAKRVYNIV